MRWPAQRPPKDGDRRIRHGYLWIPRCIDYEWRWLEYAVWEQRYYRGIRKSWWTDHCWVEDQNHGTV